MGYKDAVWKLFDGDDVVGTLTVTGSDFPWLNATFDPTEAFDKWRPLFEHELRLLETIDENVDEWEDTYRRIATGLTLHNSAGEPVAEFLLHVENGHARWRWSDEPFDLDE
ncbi:hypothetical protein ABZU76_20915 [Amycolatopsis sp. NPDC005232]|uniref:hypothetical protein n=1 Tax=Amycolatopsis sp. NPDC005232 TaxID=3157027 RepID=UPI0033ADD73B